MTSTPSGTAPRKRKKHDTLLALWGWVKANAPDTLEFSNDQVKHISTEQGFSNQFDVTHVDTKEKLPRLFIDEDVFLVNLGYKPGRHKFVRGLDHAYCALPPPKHLSDPSPWKYVPGLLDDIDDSEAGVLSLAFNRSIFADFLFDDRDRRDLQIHLPRRTKVSFDYTIGPTEVSVQSLQVEVDFLVQGPGLVGLAEAKFVDDFNKMPDFGILQLYLPYRRLMDLFRDRGTPVSVRPVFALGYRGPRVGTGVRLYEFAFPDPLGASPVKLVRSRDYILQRRPSLAAEEGIIPGVSPPQVNR
jgi:hypothetical protein